MYEYGIDFWIRDGIDEMGFVRIGWIIRLFVLGRFSNGLILGCICWTVVYGLREYPTHSIASSSALHRLSPLPGLPLPQSYPSQDNIPAFYYYSYPLTIDSYTKNQTKITIIVK